MSDVDTYIKHLESLARREDRAALAKLRRGLGKQPGTVVDLLPFVVPYLPERTRSQTAYFLVGSLFALHPESASTGNFGHVYRKLGNHESAQKRFTALLDSHEDELGDHLRRGIAMAKAEQVPVNYRQLLKDVLGWTHPERYVQLAWARSYWRSERETKPRKNNENPIANSGDEE